jgi:hypothetical protein
MTESASGVATRQDKTGPQVRIKLSSSATDQHVPSV